MEGLRGSPTSEAGRMIVGYRYSALTRGQVLAVRAALRAGVRARVLADEYGVGVRTIYRAAVGDLCPVVRIEIGDWWAEFEVPQLGPVRVTPWYAR